MTPDQKRLRGAARWVYRKQIVRQHFMQFFARKIHTSSIRRINDINDDVCVIEIVVPMLPEGVLAVDRPNFKIMDTTKNNWN